MKLFKNRTTVKSSRAGDKAAGWIASGITNMQKRWVVAMDKCFNSRSPKTRKAMLVASLVFIVAYSTLLLAFSIKSNDITRIKPSLIVPPVAVGPKGPSLPTGTPAFIWRIENFKRYLDSLSKTQSGKRIRDSLLLQRPGLLDSIKRIEIIYCSK